MAKRKQFELWTDSLYMYSSRSCQQSSHEFNVGRESELFPEWKSYWAAVIGQRD